MSRAQSGLDIDLGNESSRIAFEWAKKTFINREGMPGSPAMDIDGGFANVLQFGDLRVGVSSDGIGTKIELAERTGIYDTLGFDLTAMVVDDLVANGIEPVSLSNILDVDYLDPQVIDRLMHGLHDAARVARVAVSGGEIAELGPRISGFGESMHFNWCATAIGVLPKESPVIDGSKIHAGNHVLALRSQGFRSNGYSKIRAIMEARFGRMWHEIPWEGGTTWGQVLLTSCRIYTPAMVDLFRAGFRIKGLAHITGGGIPDNMARVLRPRRLGAVLDHLFEPPPFMKTLQRLGEVSEEVAYRLWNMGNGMLAVVSAEESSDIVQALAEMNYEAKVAGKVTTEPVLEFDTKGLVPQRLHHVVAGAPGQ